MLLCLLCFLTWITIAWEKEVIHLVLTWRGLSFRLWFGGRGIEKVIKSNYFFSLLRFVLSSIISSSSPEGIGRDGLLFLFSIINIDSFLHRRSLFDIFFLGGRYLIEQRFSFIIIVVKEGVWRCEIFLFFLLYCLIF